MRLVVNGEEVSVADGLTVQALVEQLGLTEGPVAVERNRIVVPRARHHEEVVQDGDVLEIVHFVGGG